jgi:hypothetical protein
MNAAFPEPWHLAAWVFGLAAILALPLVTTLVVSPHTRYLLMSKRAGPSDWHANQIFKETEPLDVLFLGNSRTLSAIDHAALEREVQLPGTHFASATLGANFNGYDLTYTFLNDFFARRHARLVVVQYPDFPQLDNNPAEKYIRRLGQPDPGLDIENPALTARDYGEMALVGPRLALASVIPPGPLAHEGFKVIEDTPNLDDTRGSIAPDWGYQESKTAPRAAFVRDELPRRPLPAILIRPNGPLPSEVSVSDTPLTPIETTYLPAIKSLCEKNGVELAMMMEPIADDDDPRRIVVSRQVLALGIPIMAASRERTFGDAPIDRIREYYSNYIHFNSNGARRNAEVYGPVLQAILARSGPRS